MAKGKKRLRLKKHMAALVAQNEQGQETVIDLPLTAIRPNPYQPRRSFDQVALAELAQSEKALGCDIRGEHCGHGNAFAIAHCYTSCWAILSWPALDALL